MIVIAGYQRLVRGGVFCIKTKEQGIPRPRAGLLCLKRNARYCPVEDCDATARDDTF